MIKIFIRILFYAAVAIMAAFVCVKRFSQPLQEQQTISQITPEFDADGYWRTQNLLVKKNADDTLSYYGTTSQYGAYLAARIAHMRQDFDNAAEYYKLAYEKDNENAKLNRTIYVILTSLGQIDAAGPYALRELQNNGGKNKELLAPLVVAAQSFNNGEYEAARTYMQNITDAIHVKLINPLFIAWTYAGEKNLEKAIEAIDSLPQDPQLNMIKVFHKAMIYDYLGDKENAGKFYGEIIQNYPKEVSYRVLEIITDYYVRCGNKELAQKISGHYNDNGLLALLLQDIDKKIENASETTPAIIDTPQKGLAEALFNIGTIFRTAPNGLELAQFYIATACFLNPDYEVSKIALANVLEEAGMLREANKYYAQISKNSGSYFIARIKMIENYNSLEEYDAAEEQLKILLKDNPENTQLLSDLGSIYANKRQDEDAVRVYKQAVASMKELNINSWPVFYALAISYDRLEQKEKAEENLLKALEFSNRNPNVLNYLGYSWLMRNKNISEAVQMILEAYKQYPHEGHIIDSMGWVFYRLGKYDKAIKFLEYASKINSGNAVISDHLGDAYWLGGRKNEAIFQWKHALAQKEDADSINKEAIEQKINGDGIESQPLQLSDELLLKMLDEVELTPQEK